METTQRSTSPLLVKLMPALSKRITFAGTAAPSSTEKGFCQFCRKDEN